MSRIIRIGCCDSRTDKDGVHFVGSVGARVVREVVGELGFLLGTVEELQLVGHEDCLASRVRLGLPVKAELDQEQRQRVDEETARFVEQNARELLGISVVRMALDSGVRFRLGIDDNRGRITWMKFDRDVG